MKKKLLMILTPILCLILAIISYIKFINIETDAIKFKKEYEELNGKKINDELKYNKLNINSNNPIKYSNYEEVIDIINNKTGIIYLGFPNCPWCRTAIPVLFDVAKDYDVKTIYYINIYNDRDQFEVQNNKLVYSLDENGNEKKGVEGYFNLMEALDKYLTDYTISFNNQVYETGEKRIYAPTIIFIKNGKVLGLHVSTVESQKSGFDKLSNNERKELYSIYEEYIIEMQQTSCDVGASC